MPARSRVVSALALLLLLWAARLAWDYLDKTSVAHEAMETQLKLFGAAMYEYHSSTGRWPASVDDLAQTSLPHRSYVWRQTARTLTFLWPKDISADPKQNANIVLAYDHAGLFNNLGRVWVCWGDLRTEHVREKDLRARLRLAANAVGTSVQHFASPPFRETYLPKRKGLEQNPSPREPIRTAKIA